MLKIRIGNATLTVGSIYGSNNDDCNFFDTLREITLRFNSDFCIIGGDWNTTLDGRPSNRNIDTLNTVSIPSERRSNWLNNLCTDLNLIDPFRYFYPDITAFTYVPFAEAATNRSRLDFFLISSFLTQQCINCRIPHNLSSLMFDHKQVFLNFQRDNPYKKQTINDVIVKDTDLQDIVNIAVIECYLNHILPSANLTAEILDRHRLAIGRVLNLQKSLNDVKLHIAMNGFDEETNANCVLLKNSIKNHIDLLPSLDELQQEALSCGNDVFLEILIMSVKNSSLAHQHNLFKVKNAKKLAIEKNINILKQDVNANAGEILRLESTLNRIVEAELRDKLLKMHNFEKLNDVKITPYFLSLAKRPHHAESLCDITRDDGTIFENRVDRGNYIKNHFASTYKRLPDTVTDQSINEFLGDSADAPEVAASKLRDEEKNDLESELTILEFDKAVELAKPNTAPGIDSISNRFIKTFWGFFRFPLFQYAKTCYEKGQLTENFRSAKIRLILKKGDLSLLKNWRPISLLNCFYKIISRVIALRLKRVMDKITSVAQKGISSTKYCQEVLIGVVDSINHINFRKKHGALLSLDIKKAFDSTSHSYLQQAYKFFNFGPNFIRWLNLVATNRRACIILENEVYSEYFDLERGNAQGDTTSPYIFNIGFQILLFKLTFDLQISGLIDFPELPDGIPPLPPAVGTYNRKVSAYADDANMLVQLEYQTLLRIKNILVEFGHLSGLECNVDKTTLMVIGNPMLIDERIRELGFKFVENTTILGLTINSTADLLPNFESIKTKIKNIISSWRPFMLSLPGRINIAKSMLYSQINYLGCFLNIPPNIIVDLETLIVNFVKGRMNIAKKRLFRTIEDGGSGLFDLDDFLGAQQCTWIKRSSNLNEQWKVLLYICNYGRIYNAKANNICKEEYPILENICRNYDKFQNLFTKHNENFKRSYIIENKNVTRALENRELIRRNIFGNAFLRQNTYSFLGLRYCDFYNDDGTMVQARDVIAVTGIQFTVMQLQTIRSACSVLRERCSKQEISEQKHCSIDEFLIRHKRGSGHIRKNCLHMLS